MGYLGCGTGLNKALWAGCAGLLLLGAILIAVGGSKLAPCRRSLDACKAARGAGSTGGPRNSDVCFMRFRECGRGHIITGAVGVLSFLAALLLVCGMCCCAPAPKVDPAAAGIQMNAAHHYPTAQPAGDPNSSAMAYGQQQPYAPYGQQQPYQAQPYGGAAVAAAPYGAAAAADPYAAGNGTYTPFQGQQQGQQYGYPQGAQQQQQYQYPQGGYPYPPAPQPGQPQQQQPPPAGGVPVFHA